MPPESEKCIANWFGIVWGTGLALKGDWRSIGNSLFPRLWVSREGVKRDESIGLSSRNGDEPLLSTISQ